MRKNIFYLAVLLFVLTSCEFKCNIGKTTEEGKEVSSSTDAVYKDNVNTSQIKNDIEIKASGDVKVYRAFLTEEDGTLIKDNATTFGKPIYLKINVENGWKEVDGKTFLGASETISTDNGTDIVNSGDLFSDYDVKGMDPDISKFITLKAVVSHANGPIEYYVVDFRVWDKKGNGEIKGSYKFKIKE